MHAFSPVSPFFFFNDTATTEIYTLSLHDALPIFGRFRIHSASAVVFKNAISAVFAATQDRKSTRLNSSHQIISYAVFCLKKKKYPTDGVPDPPRQMRADGRRHRQPRD